MNIAHQQLTLDMIDQSPEIGAWVTQFPEDRRPTAIDMLLKLRFIRQDVYVDWLKDRLLEIDPGPCALYAVRKFDETVTSYWDGAGEPPLRPAQSLGSEDLIQLVLASIMKAGDPRFLDHPGIQTLKERQVRNLVLIDDSLGSGQRVGDFLDLFMKNKTLRSWWSYGLIQLHIVALVRSHAAQERILRYLPGSDHHSRIHPKSRKIHFIGHFHYDEEEFWERWGVNAMQILNLCDSVEAIPPIFQRGYGGVMSNQIFYHSVPDNVPGVLWCTERGWHPLFPKRVFPVWLSRMLGKQADVGESSGGQVLAASLLPLLRTLRRGVRGRISTSRAMGLDPKVTEILIKRAQSAGLVSGKMHLTVAGAQVLWNSRSIDPTIEWDRSLYVPSQWCVGRGTVQPSPSGEPPWKTESKASSLAEDGDDRSSSLERTDARSATPPLSVVTQLPSETRVGDDTHGPMGQKDK